MLMGYFIIYHFVLMCPFRCCFPTSICLISRVQACRNVEREDLPQISSLNSRQKPKTKKLFLFFFLFFVFANFSLSFCIEINRKIDNKVNKADDMEKEMGYYTEECRFRYIYGSLFISGINDTVSAHVKSHENANQTRFVALFFEFNKQENTFYFIDDCDASFGTWDTVVYCWPKNEIVATIK